MSKLLNIKIYFLAVILLELTFSPMTTYAVNQNIGSTIYYTEWSRLRHLAEEGVPEALFQLGNLYYQSPPNSGIPQSDKKAFKLFLRAAKIGHAASQHNVGVLYLKGQGVEQSDNKALAWFMIASDNGNKSAKRAVARMSTSDINIVEVTKIKNEYQEQINNPSLIAK